MSVTTITRENFDSVVGGSEPVLVDFWAEWCSPCRMLSPIVDEIAESAKSVKVGKVNVDEQQELASRFGVMSIPTLIVFKDGKPVRKSVGVRPKEEVEALIAGV